jgi:hypothetical protein
MTSRQDVQKRLVWKQRLGRYRQSGLTVAGFCESEHVSVNTFYYWARRVGAGSTVMSSSPRSDVAEPRREPMSPSHVAAGTGLVRFYFSAAVEASVPADCLDAIRCLAQCVQQPRAECSGAFQEVVVTTR